MFGILILVFSLFGFDFALRVAGAEVHLAWITSFLLQILIMYGFAMCHQLLLGMYFVNGLGCLLFAVVVLGLLLGKLNFPFSGTHLFDLWMIAMGIFMGIVLYNSPLIHYDNYTHWALIVKFLTYTNRLPGAHDALITYTSYPPATALFITRIVKLLGFRAGVMLVAQFLLIWSSLYAMFGVLKDKSRGLFSLLLCFVIAISNVFNIAIRMNNLLVDYILPVLAVAGVAAVYVYRRHPWWQLGTVALIGGSILLVKNSGTFFVVVMVVYLGNQVAHTVKGAWWRKGLASIGAMLATGIVAYLPFAWWNWHVKHTFTLSKHEISTAAYQHQLAHETTAQIMGIGRRMIQTLMSGHSLSASGILLINAALLIGWLVIRLWSKRRNPLLKTAVWLDVMFGLYVISLFGMYVLAMPYSEAKLLDGYERYMSSIVIFGLFLATMVAVVVMDESMYEQRYEKRSLRTFHSIFTKNAYQVTTLVLLIFSIIMMFSESNGVAYANRQNKNALPQQLDRIMTQRTTLNHNKVAIVDPHADDVANYYAGYVGRYYFFSDQVVGQENWNMSREQFKQAVLGFDYVAIPEWHRTFSVMVKQVWGQSIKTGVFKVTKPGLFTSVFGT
ncbi:ABC transporter permease [Lacticaseibacillus sp. GG6-2]